MAFRCSSLLVLSSLEHAHAQRLPTEVRVIDIVEHLGWAIQTYQNKSLYYASAAHVAGQQWYGDTPSKLNATPGKSFQ